MKLFISELQYLSELYDLLRVQLSQIVSAEGGDAKATANAVLRNRELLSRVEQVDGRISRLTKDWETFHQHLTPQSIAEVHSLAQSVKKQAEQLATLIEVRIRELEEWCSRLEQRRTALNQGSRYLESLQPARTNYPKFIDSQT